MDLARVRSRVVLSALSGLALAAVLAGCAAPSDSEKARFNSISGVVLDTAGNPVPGAAVRVISSAGAAALGTTNYNGDTGPFVTDANGRFVIEGVQINTATPAVLDLQASKSGYIPAIVTYTVPATSAITVAGRTFVAGQQTPDIVVVGGTPITGASATLTPVGTVAQVGPGGNAANPIVIGVAAARSRQAISGRASLSFPAGALNQIETVSFTSLDGASLPSQAPFVTGTGVAPSSNFSIAGPLFACFIELDPSPGGPINLPATLTASLPLTVGQLGGQQLVVRQLSADSRAWVTLTNTVTVSADPNTGRAQASVGLTTFGALMITQTDANAPKWTTGAASSTGVVEDFPPIASFPQGYVVPSFLEQTLVVTNAAGSDEQAYLVNDFTSGSLGTGNGPVPVIVGARSAGVRATQFAYSFTVTYTANGVATTRTGTRTYWQFSEIPLAPVSTPTGQHFQGHVQGSGTSF